MSLAEVFAKANARLAKLAAKEKAIKEGKPFRLVGALNTIERLKRAEEKAREQYLEEVMTKRAQILGASVDIKRIDEKWDVTSKANRQAVSLMQNADKIRALARLDLFAIDLKIKVANEDVDFVVDAAEHYENFYECLRDYVGNVVQVQGTIDEAKVKQIWHSNLSATDVKVLCRGTTIYDSIDYHVNRARIALEANSDIEATFTTLNNDLNTLFEQYNITTRT